jgi:signal transduction histidine kinase
LLQASAAPDGAPYRLTDRGRRWFLNQIGTWAADAAELDAEHREVNQLRSDLMFTVSHELRTPLTLIRTSIGLLLDSSPDEDMLLRLLHNIKRSSERMHALINDLLDLARLHGDHFPLQIRTIDTGTLVDGAVSLMQPLLDAKRQTVARAIPAPPPVVPGDYRQIERVLLNLLGNANKFAPRESEIAISIREDEREATIAVQDVGPGISASSMPHLFDEYFVVAANSSPHSVGAGLGLPIAKGIVEAHGGRIWAESAVGVGTTISFTLPKVSLREELDEGVGGR